MFLCTEEIYIYDIEDLEKIRKFNPEKDLKITLKKSVDFSENKNFEPIDLSFYDGNILIDGGNNTIYNLTINKPLEDNVGLFRCFGNDKSVVVKNLTIANPQINGKENVGVIAGSMNGYIHNCHIQYGMVNGRNYIGGFIGKGEKAIFHSCKSNACVKAEELCGGLVGFSSFLEIKDSHLEFPVFSSTELTNSLTSSPYGHFINGNIDEKSSHRGKLLARRNEEVVRSKGTFILEKKS